MIVTFISQCEKKAIPRTRRVLDAFADRIGDNTWQTVITEEGLIAVKKLLRKTVTKSTAVSCHWIRGRRRSELLWIVGNRNRFNNIGVVPVNSTQKDVFMDVITMKAKQDEFNVGMQIGGGVQVSKLLFDLRYEFGLGKIGSEIVNSDGRQFQTENRPQMLNLSVAYLF